MLHLGRGCFVLSVTIIFMTVFINESNHSAIARKLQPTNAITRMIRNLADNAFQYANHDQQQQGPYQRVRNEISDHDISVRYADTTSLHSPFNHHESYDGPLMNWPTEYPSVKNDIVNVYHALLPMLQMPMLQMPMLQLPMLQMPMLQMPMLQMPNTKCPPCQLPTITLTTCPPTPPSKGCRPTFIRLGDKCYHLSEKKAKWLDANTTCSTIGGEFAHPNQKENQILKDHLRKLNSSKNWWIGANDRTVEHHYVWAHDRSNVTFFDWDRDAIIMLESLESDCLALMRKRDFRWDDEICNNQYRYICEHGLAI